MGWTLSPIMDLETMSAAKAIQLHAYHVMSWANLADMPSRVSHSPAWTYPELGSAGRLEAEKRHEATREMFCGSDSVRALDGDASTATATTSRRIGSCDSCCAWI